MRATILCVLAGATTAATAQNLSQPNNDLCERSFISDGVSGQFFNRRQADNVRVSGSGQITSIRWWGAIAPFGGVFDLSNVAAYRVQIFSDGGGFPNSIAAPVYDQQFNIADTNPRQTGFNSSGDNAPQFEHTVELPTPFSLSSGSDFWITIGAVNTNPGGPGWRWSSSLNGDFVTAQQTPFGGDWTVFDPSGANYSVVFNPPADGAICTPSGDCVIGTAEQAFTMGGFYQGDGTDCAVGCDAFAVFTQGPSQPCNPSFNSDAVPGQFAGSLSAESFELPADATVDGVRWWGGSQFFQEFDLFNFESWTVTIYGSDAAGAPDDSQIVYTREFFQNDTNPVLTDYRNRQDADLYEQSVTFDAPVDLQGGTPYWISIGTTNFDPNGDGWRWLGSLNTDGKAASKSWATGEWAIFNPAGISYAFQLLGDSDPVNPGCSPADLAAPFGVLNFFDVLAYLSAFNAGDPSADLAAPNNTLNFFDVLAYLNLFNAGCP